MHAVERIRFEKYILDFEIGLSPAGLTQATIKVFTFQTSHILTEWWRMHSMVTDPLVSGYQQNCPSFYLDPEICMCLDGYLH